MLRAPSEADRDTWIALHRDPRTYTHAPHAMAASDEVASVQFDKVLAHWDREGYGYHLVEEQGQVVGCGGLKRNDDPAELNLYYRLVFGAAGQGLAREAARAWVAWGLEWLPTLPIVAAAAEHNAASVATARTCGLVPTSRRLLPGDPPEFGAAVILTAPRVDVVRTEGFDPVTLAQVLDLWVATTAAGGAVGFLPGDSRERHAEALAHHEADMVAGDVTAVLLRAPDTDRVVAIGFWQRPSNPLLHHRRRRAGLGRVRAAGRRHPGGAGG